MNDIMNMKILVLSLLVTITACTSAVIDEEQVTAAAEETQEYVLENNSIYQLRATTVSKEIYGNQVEMFGYNKQIPGPLLHVQQGTTVWINFTNDLFIPTTIHWHGIRLENAYDGVPMLTQNEIQPGEDFLYKLDFPDAGIYWYHPHMREDWQQEFGLYGNILVEATEQSYEEADREVALILDDVLLKEDGIEAFYDDLITYSLMGRFGNVMLINGQTDYTINVTQGDIVRFHLTNAANSRVFNFSITHAQMKRIGGDSGAYQKEAFVPSIIISPGERYTVDVLFEEAGISEMLHTNPYNIYHLGTMFVQQSDVDQKKLDEFEKEKQNPLATTELEEFRKYLEKDPDIMLDISVQLPHMMSMGMMQDIVEGIEWEDTMMAMNSQTTNETITWILTDSATGKQNMDIFYHWNIGDRVKIRITNKATTMHPMQHPIHLHGQRFVVIAENGISNENLVWKDTVLVPVGSYIDIVVDITNPGKWMGHCHIAEHLQSGMMFMFTVEE
ncbi:MAG: multicopper oxidase family protein [Nanoarchaeota archaeon]